jgi:uncharacterized protein YqcC (DUF446 family)
MSEAKKRARLAVLAGEIESEMRRIGVWRENLPSEEKVLEGGAFGLGTVSFDTWLQVVFVTRLRQAANGDIDIPHTSSVAAQSAREWDGDPLDRGRLQELIEAVDSTVGR